MASHLPGRPPLQAPISILGRFLYLYQPDNYSETVKNKEFLWKLEEIEQLGKLEKQIRKVWKTVYIFVFA